MFSLGKCGQTTAKTMVVDRKNQKALALLYLAWDCCQRLQTQAMCRLSSKQNRTKHRRPKLKMRMTFAARLCMEIHFGSQCAKIKVMNAEINFTYLNMGLSLCLVFNLGAIRGVLGEFLVRCCSRCCFST